MTSRHDRTPTHFPSNKKENTRQSSKTLSPLALEITLDLKILNLSFDHFLFLFFFFLHYTPTSLPSNNRNTLLTAITMESLIVWTLQPFTRQDRLLVMPTGL